MTQTKESKQVWTDGWALWRKCFKDGHDVIAIDVDDEFHWGKLRTLAERDGIELIRPGRRANFIAFNDIRFVSHDGFPVQELMGADGSETITKLTSAGVKDAIREAIDLTSEPSPRRYGFIGGDPFTVYASQVELLNAGNSGPRFYNAVNEEVLKCQAAGGAIGLLWDLDTVFHFERDGRTVAMAS
jgi:hypothetical protein